MSSPFGNLDDARAAIGALVERYTRNRERYRSPSYNEESLRAEFVSPLLDALGWDVANRTGAAEQYKDVVHEETIAVGETLKAPDYTVRFGGVRKFFVGAKRPTIDIKTDAAPAYQLRRYAWSARLPLSILTNFEDLAVYDTRVRPSVGDKPAAARILHVSHDQLPARFQEVWELLSKTAVHEGSFDGFADDARRARGTALVDAEFLKEIEGWRSTLAANLALRNPDITVDELNFAVQAIVDRIIFLRIAEARGIEVHGRLLAAARGAQPYVRLLELWRGADQRYNSGLFDFSTDLLTPKLVADDKVVRAILESLYYPKSPYEFSVLPAAILGDVYEQFLGKVIRLTKGHRAKIDTKPEVKKQGGVVYTPDYIVRAIVQATLGRSCAGMAPDQLACVRVVDPACGSGSFLLAVYQDLLQRHLEWYVGHRPERHSQAVFFARSGWRLTTYEKRRILIRSVFGVDIDRQAVEVTKLSLLLQLLEGETEETLGQSLRLFGERALPSLEGNIKCGNSLLSPRDLPAGLFPDQSRPRALDVFDWQAEFPQVFREGGFDVALGNPPYVRLQTLHSAAPTDLYRSVYRSASKGNFDVYTLFIERGLALLKATGVLGYIVPHKFLNSSYGAALRSVLAAGRHVQEIVHFGDQQVFPGRSTYTCLLFLGHSPSSEVRVTRVGELGPWRNARRARSGTIRAVDLDEGAWNLTLGPERALFGKLNAMTTRLEHVARRIFQGCITGADTVFLFKEHEPAQGALVAVHSKALGKQMLIEASVLRPVVRSGAIGRFHASPRAWVLFPYSVSGSRATLLSPRELRDRAPRAWRYLEANREELQGRERGAFNDAAWYRFGRTQNLGLWEQPKLMVPYMVKRLSCHADVRGGLYFINVTTGGYGLRVDEEQVRNGLDPLYVCALLNSAVLNFYWRQASSNFQGGYHPANKQFISSLPIRMVERRDRAGQQRQERLADLATRLGRTSELRARCRTPAERERLRHEEQALDHQLESLVAELYGLTDPEFEAVLAGARDGTQDDVARDRPEAPAAQARAD